MDPLLAMMLSVIAARAIPLVALILRLRAQLQCERRRQHTLVTMAAHLSPHDVLEVDHTIGRGNHFRLRLVAGHEIERENDARA